MRLTLEPPQHIPTNEAVKESGGNARTLMVALAWGGGGAKLEKKSGASFDGLTGAPE